MSLLHVRSTVVKAVALLVAVYFLVHAYPRLQSRVDEVDRFANDVTPRSSESNVLRGISQDAPYELARYSEVHSQPHPLEGNSFLSHIPKSGSTFALEQIQKMLEYSPEWQSLSAAGKFQACQFGTMRLDAAPEKWTNRAKGRFCTLFMTENKMGWAAPAEQVYVILRQPETHILSQYFHCKESKSHAHSAHLMPSLNEWLETYVSAKGDATLVNQANQKYRCYNPINMQSSWLNYLGIDCHGNTCSLSQNAKEVLKQRYTILGDNSQMTKTVCAIFITYTGWIDQERCNCTVVAGNQSDFAAKRGNSHGVMHHGSTYKTTQEQDEYIQQLSDIDRLLYQAGREAFAEQVREIEEEYRITLCG